MEVKDKSECAAIIKRIMSEYAKFKPSYGDVEVETIFDDTAGHYEMIYSGWDEHRRVHGTVIHVDIRGEKVWIQHDGTEAGIAEEFVAAGIPYGQIVLGFRHPERRKHTRFAVA